MEPGQWVEHGGRWVWDDTAPAGDESPTHIGMHAGQATPSSPQVLDPSIGADGGGHPDVEPLPVFNDETDDGWDTLGPAQVAPGPDLVACPACGGGVHPDRLH